MARALRLIQEKEAHFHVRADRYITCGFSAGGMLICLWNTEMGYPAFSLPKPQASFPVYPFVSLKLAAADYNPEEDTGEDEREDIRLYGRPFAEAMESMYDSPEHAEGFPPCAIFVLAGDELLGHSKLLAEKLEQLKIPCRLEIGPEGGHGFADGTGTCIAGWTERAVRWYEGLK
jgi:acetyl esterase/lipase